MKLKHLAGVLLALLLGSEIGEAQESYSFSICGVEVTSENVNALDKIDGVTVRDGGYITYSPNQETLMIKNVTLQSKGSTNCIRVNSDFDDTPLGIRLEGENRFNSPDGIALYMEGFACIKGRDNLSIRAKDAGIYVTNNSTLTIKDCSVDIQAAAGESLYAGIEANWESYNYLKIRNASVYVKASRSNGTPYPYAIGGFNSILLEGSLITKPDLGEVGTYTFDNGGETYTRSFIVLYEKPEKEVRIKKVIDSYNFSICSVDVTSANVDNLDEISGVIVGDGGYITYSPEDHTLRIKDVTISNDMTSSIIDLGDDFGDQALRLHLEGKNKFGPAFGPTLRLYSDLCIEGSGELFIRARDYGILMSADALLSIADCAIEIVPGENYELDSGICSSAIYHSQLEIKNANIYAKVSADQGTPISYAIGDFESILLEGVTITEPRNGVVGSYTFQSGDNSYTRQFIMSGDKPAVEVRIERSLAVETVDLPDLCISPNPADRLVRLEGAEGGMTVSLYSLQGVRQLSVTTDQLGVANLDVSHLPSGSYILEVGGNNLKLLVRH